MKIYDIVHILWKNETKFGPNLIKYVNAYPGYFGEISHLFIVASEKAYDECKGPNVILDQADQRESNCAELINKYGKYGKHIIVHSICSVHEIFNIKRKYIRKIIWRTWGHDAITPFAYHKGRFFSNSVKRIINYMWRNRIKSFAAIGVANLVDEIDIKRRFGNVKTVRITYRINNDLPSTDGVSTFVNGSVCNIMLGHSGYPNDNHFELLEKLKRYRNNPINIILVLSYGDKEYILRLKEYVKNNWDSKVTIIENFMPYSDYLKLIRSVDIAIFDGLNSYALGNISLLISEKKKIVLNKDGIIKTAFDIDNVPYETTNSVFEQSFEKFACPLQYNSFSGKELTLKSTEEQLKIMQQSFAQIMTL